MAPPYNQQRTQHNPNPAHVGSATIQRPPITEAVTGDPDPSAAKELSAAEVRRVSAAIRMSQQEEKDTVDYNNQKFTYGSFTFKELLQTILSQTMDNKITPTKARQYMYDWAKSMTPEEKEEFVAKRNEHDITMNYFKGCVDTLSQEMPYLYSNL